MIQFIIITKKIKINYKFIIFKYATRHKKL